jgi:hypothetical protein
MQHMRATNMIVLLTNYQNVFRIFKDKRRQLGKRAIETPSTAPTHSSALPELPDCRLAMRPGGPKRRPGLAAYPTLMRPPPGPISNGARPLDVPTLQLRCGR